TVSSDEMVTSLYQKNSVKRKLKKLFPDAVSGCFSLSIDRKKIAEKVFFDKALHKKLTDLVTPLVFNEIFKVAKKVNGVLFAEVPLLFECNYQNAFDGVVVIAREKSARIEAVKARSKLTEQEILARMENQIDYEKQDFSNFVVIENNGDVEKLTLAISEYLKTI
ncbi:MAG: dephospho-CoA kinase, partial [Clostridia bacterium]|nr:dephospho-CoA kinase [Clostridia bacterium]